MTRPECELRRLHEHSLLRSVASPAPTSPSIGRSDYAALHLRVRPLRPPGRQIAASAYNYALLKPLCVRYSEGSISVYGHKLSSAATFRLPPRHRSFLTVSRRSIPLPTRHRHWRFAPQRNLRLYLRLVRTVCRLTLIRSARTSKLTFLPPDRRVLTSAFNHGDTLILTPPQAPADAQDSDRSATPAVAVANARPCGHSASIGLR